MTPTCPSRRTTQKEGSRFGQGIVVPPPRTKPPLATGVARLGNLDPDDETDAEEEIPFEELIWLKFSLVSTAVVRLFCKQ